MITNAEVLIKAQSDLKEYELELAKEPGKNLKEILEQCIDLTKEIIRQSEEEIAKGNP